MSRKRELSEIQVLPILESLRFIEQHRSSVVRFGDGEIDIINGESIPYQDYDEQLAVALKLILQRPSSEDLLVCLPDVFQKIERYNQNAQFFWKSHFEKYENFYQEECQSDWYGSTFLSRPYIDLEDKSLSVTYFAAIRNLWQGRDILLVEGETSRSGVGNDLFANANSISRIVCPSKNAFDHYDEIMEGMLEHVEGKLVILMLGPTAKVLAYDLMERGYQAIDLGHIDSEYEWYQMKAKHKIKLKHKHTAEFNWDEEIEFAQDEAYERQIVATVGIEPAKEEEAIVTAGETISIIVPVYNVERYLKRCLDSLVKQTYVDFELLLINDGSTDNSALICEEYARTDSRIRVIHQENAGPSAARNRGLELARGRYITFVDSDDFVEVDYLENLHTALEKNEADISICNFNSFNEERQSFLFSITKEMYFEQTYTVEEWLNQENTAKNNLYLTFTFSPLKLFKRELFDGIVFPIGRLREDDATIYKLYLKARKIAFINQGAYYYSQRSEGLSRNGMLDDIRSMIGNAEERIALLVTLGYDVREHVDSYIKRLKKCQADSLRAGQIHLYQDLTAKLDLIEHYQKEK
ncbi:MULTISPECIES: SP_1767 family glycosyltransferase [unclassified Streptococcus]|uniref:SP_1767 family glycosyltransferase n=1 Tax=unclassified Streptococcus TaxID=2608887 RepID=UPI00107290DB|nr:MULTISPECIES: SP_1767 family glycosyltransferase [unclassified Streptococcus]MBF0787147.1 SP_1767 family glycosyltransferase [Streptococcus sp. 19428wC2_LYSM12]MCQ9212137.1 SP_1767 family glycosyltransferase [Streptococcus sp. B01]MCQ9213466.1 SP_1767 family glycosyltransferase [Streptococcus sp. O1]TFV05903.1 SP_1767 family glycosyltransferase [Streptococcus sp. LYSM12]